MSARKARTSRTQGVPIHFIKGNAFRVVHADGAWGGVGPHGLIQMALYSERIPIPRAVHVTVEDGRILDEVKREGREGIVREVEVEVLMSLQTATSLRDWLSDKIDEAREALPAEETRRG